MTMNALPDIDRARCCCFTGHRPEKLPLSEAQLKAMLGREIDCALADGYDTFISGMARGIDVYAAEEVVARQAQGAQLICAFPFADSHLKFTEHWRTRCLALEQQAIFSVNVCPHYHISAFSRRNDWMVERSSRLIAVFNGTRGGTFNTIKRATKQGLDIRIIMVGLEASPQPGAQCGE